MAGLQRTSEQEFQDLMLHQEQSIKSSREASWSNRSHFPNQLRVLLANHHAALRVHQSSQMSSVKRVCVRMSVCVCVNVCVYMDEWMYMSVCNCAQVDKWMMDGWMDRWFYVCVCVLMTRWMDECVSVCVCVCVCVCIYIHGRCIYIDGRRTISVQMEDGRWKGECECVNQCTCVFTCHG